MNCNVNRLFKNTNIYGKGALEGNGILMEMFTIIKLCAKLFWKCNDPSIKK